MGLEIACDLDDNLWETENVPRQRDLRREVRQFNALMGAGEGFTTAVHAPP